MNAGRLGRVLSAWWAWGVLALLVWCGAVWFVGPLIVFGDFVPLGRAAIRLALILPAVALWGVANLWLRLRQARANRKLVEDLGQAERDQIEREAAERAAVDEELAAIRMRSAQALELLRRPTFGRGLFRRYLYQLPWYVVIGPPASGKTTALMNADLVFPLDHRLGPRGMSGLGGTRNTDWWLAEEALLIDTAGRYTTQDSRPAVDGAVWTGFLSMVKRHRPRRPLNGVLVVVSPSELTRMGDAERAEQADCIRLRLLELKETLGVRLPVYVLFSKADLVPGFAEFFDALGREDRAQVWGSTFPFDDERTLEPASERFGSAFDGLTARLNQRVLRRLQEEPDPRRRGLILDFPAQLAMLKPVMAEFLDRVFRPHRYEGRLLLRGFYMASSTQRGMPTDLLDAAVAPAFGLDGAEARPGLEPQTGVSRACFLPRLFREVIFAESDLVGFDRHLALGRLWAGWAAATLALTALILAAPLCWAAFDAGRSVLRTALSGADGLSVVTTLPGRAAGEMKELVNILDRLRGLQPDLHAVPPVGLVPAAELDDAATRAYDRGLRRLLLPRLVNMAEGRLRDPATPRPLMLETLKAYLMLAGDGPLDRDMLSSWLDHEVRSRSPGETGVRDSLARHMRALVAVLPVKFDLDRKLVAETRSRLSGMTLAVRGYEMIRGLEVARSLPPWRPSDHAGAAAAKVLVRPSGRSLWDGIDGLYTRSGFFDVFLPAATKVADELAKESWVLGEPGRSAALAGSIRADMLGLYLDDYVRNWDDLLVDVVAMPFHSSSHAADNLNILAGPNSPLKKFLTAVAGETDLDTPPRSLLAAVEAAAKSPKAPDGAPTGLVDQALSQVGHAVSPQVQLAMATGFLGGGKETPPPGRPVTEYFHALRRVVQGEDGAQPAMDTVMKGMGDMYKVFNKLAATPANTASVMANSEEMQTVTGRAMIQAGGLPSPMDSMVGAVAESAAAVAVGGARDYMDIIWHNMILPKCRAVVDSRYPFDRGSVFDAPLADFASLLGADGDIGQFFNTHLKPFVDATASPWRWQSVDGVGLGLSDDVLAQFERADLLRRSLFPEGSKTPRIHFKLEPQKVSESIDRVVLNLDGQELRYSHGPAEITELQWPSPQGGAAAARLSFSPERGEDKAVISTKGAYASLRLLQAGTLTPTGMADRFQLEFALGPRKAGFILIADSLNNPFTVLPELEKFSCPSWRDRQ